MDWPHDPDGVQGSEGRRNYGHAILAKKVDEDNDFPLAAAEFVEEYGDDPIRIDYERIVSVAEIFEYIDDEAEFEDFPDFHAEVGAALRQADLWPYRLEHS